MAGQPIPTDLHSSLPYLPGCWQALSQAVSRAVNSSAASIEDMCVDHCRADVLVPEKFLDRPNIVAVLKQMRALRQACSELAEELRANGQCQRINDPLHWLVLRFRLPERLL